MLLDLTRLLPGAVATRYFAERGAEVIKIEQPGQGDYARQLSPPLFAETNRGKKSVCIDLKHPAGRLAFLQIARSADILVESFRPGVMTRLGLSYETLSTRHVSLIYASISGYGQNGPFSGLAGHDINYIAVSGLLSLNSMVIPGTQFGDLVGGSMHAIMEILLALYKRTTTGKGCYLDISMTAGLDTLLTLPRTELLQNSQKSPLSDLLRGEYACYNVYEAGDRRWLACGALEPKFWSSLCRALRREDLIGFQFDPARQPELKRSLSAIFLTKKAAEWFEFLRPFDCCVTPAATLSELLPSSSPRQPAPGLGEHTSAILERFGVPSVQIESLRRAGAISP